MDRNFFGFADTDTKIFEIADIDTDVDKSWARVFAELQTIMLSLMSISVFIVEVLWEIVQFRSANRHYILAMSFDIYLYP